ncbi:hypothetical protein IGI37_003156 [Enterococcus sp. AZ194]|uniref:aminoglycoside phosphotransferase family protein n=1 Tax=Enterococcus sp. AZ194 TaxID=2774629 RepID=UPI003F25D322
MEELEKLAEMAGWLSIEPINKGWSSDKKFCIQTKQGTQLLRLFPKNQLESKRREFSFIGQVAELKLNTPSPIICQSLPDSDKAYMLLSYVKGKDLSNTIHQLSTAQQYKLGKEAGRGLKKIHQLPILSMDSPKIFQTLYAKKANQLQRYLEINKQLPGQELMIDYVSEQLAKIPNRPACLLHGDYHIGNFVYQKQAPLGIIDFDRSEIGDAYEEFFKVQFFSREQSPAFARGQIDGYFSNRVPQEFWEAQKFYCFHAALYSIVWAAPYGEKDVEGMIERFHQVQEDYQEGQLIPKWYQELDRYSWDKG